MGFKETMLLLNMIIIKKYEKFNFSCSFSGYKQITLFSYIYKSTNSISNDCSVA